jgi:hypothetical protein
MAYNGQPLDCKGLYTVTEDKFSIIKDGTKQELSNICIEVYTTLLTITAEQKPRVQYKAPK